MHDAASVEEGLRLGRETPAVARPLDIDANRGGHLDGPSAIGRSSLKQGDQGFVAFAEASSQDGACRAGSYDDVVKTLGYRLPLQGDLSKWLLNVRLALLRIPSLAAATGVSPCHAATNLRSRQSPR